jgi:hypothetical protein
MSASIGTRRTRPANLAGDMRTAVEGSHAQSQCRLPHGLEIVLQRQDGQWRLTLAREWVWPSEEEMEGCLAAFHVPDGALQRRGQQCLRHPKSGRRTVSYVVELSWTERDNDHSSQT